MWERQKSNAASALQELTECLRDVSPVNVNFGHFRQFRVVERIWVLNSAKHLVFLDHLNTLYLSLLIDLQVVMSFHV